MKPLTKKQAVEQLNMWCQRSLDLEDMVLQYAELCGHKTVGDAASTIRLPHDQQKVVPPSPNAAVAAIVGGSPTSDFPDCCALGNSSNFFCTGTLIASNFVLTAKHCASVTKVLIGSDNVRSAGGELQTVASRIQHPSLDLQLLHLANNSTIAPRRIARGADAQAVIAILAGFGMDDFQGTSGFGIKRTVQVPIETPDCQGQGESQKFGCAPGAEMVAGHRGLRRDTCKGDSGGPLYVQSPDRGPVLLGVTSRGARNDLNVCGDGAVYVRADLAVAWIEQQLGTPLP